jgi:hypothetical protein
MIDWAARAASERRMRQPWFQAVSRALGQSIVRQSLDPLVEAIDRTRAREDDVAFAVRRHGVAGFLVRLPGIEAAGLGERLIQALRAEAEAIAARAQVLSDDLYGLGTAAARRGLRFSPLKGAYLRTERYASADLRPSADLDLFVEAPDIEGWRAVLVGAGYRERPASARHRVFHREWAPRPRVDGDHPAHPRPVEVHERLTERCLGRRFDITDAYRANLQPGTMLGDLPACVPGDTGLALHLVLHAAPAMLDRGLRLAQLVDLQFVDESPATVEALSRQLGDVAWAVAALTARDVPGLLAPALDKRLPGPQPWRQRAILSRPGLLTGDPLRAATLVGELRLTRSPTSVVRRLAGAWHDRAALEAPGTPSTLASYLSALGGFVRGARGGRDRDAAR